MRKLLSSLPLWTLVVPLIGWMLLGGSWYGFGSWYSIPLAAGLLGCVLAAVHHAEVIAHRIGEPFGTLMLAVAVTVIEVGLIVSLMLAGGPAANTLPRDTVFAAVMLILNGMVGTCLLVGSHRHGEQTFTLAGVSASLATLAAIVTLTLVLPNYTLTTPGPAYSPSQLSFIAVISLVLYGTFLLVQTVRHRDYFLPAEGKNSEDQHAVPPAAETAWTSAAALVVALAAVVLLGKSLAPAIERAVAAMGAPQALVGIIVAGVVLMPESLAAVRAARANRLQTSLNLALGSALASIGLTIPVVAIVSLASGWTLSLGIDAKSTVLLFLSLMVATLSLSTGRTTVLQGVVHLVIFAAYLLVTVVP
ncbi:MAG TPA: ionic transporter y4hA [Ramlibacter sp.]|nr:ionic transporter y4hA [Ramlibacter sp.]